MSTREKLTQKADQFLAKRQDRDLRSLLVHQDFHMVAQVIDALDRGKRKTFALLPPEKQAEVAFVLSEDSKARIFPRLSDEVIARFLHFSDEDDATDILQYLHANRRASILLHMKEERRLKIEKLLKFGSETAGGLMDLNFILVKPQFTFADVVEKVRKHMEEKRDMPAVLVVTELGKILGIIPEQVLLFPPGSTTVDEQTVPIAVVSHKMDREKVMQVMTRMRSEVLCVADEHGAPLGIVHLKDLLKVVQAEVSEDLYRMGAVGFLDTSYLKSSFGTIWRKRVGWLSVLFLAELFTFTALARFESSIAAVTALALFVPLCISTGGNSGSQAATLVTRALALGHIKLRDWWRVLRRELLMGVALGLALGAVAFIRASLTPQHVLGTADRWTMGLVIALSVAAICLWGTIVGSMLPIAFKKLGADPGYASSPFVATFVDVTGIVIYFSIARVFIFV